MAQAPADAAAAQAAAQKEAAKPEAAPAKEAPAAAAAAPARVSDEELRQRLEARIAAVRAAQTEHKPAARKPAHVRKVAAPAAALGATAVAAHAAAGHGAGHAAPHWSYGGDGGPAANAAEVAPEVARIRAAAGLPVVVGFGISTPEAAEAVAGVADGCVVGSAIVKLIGEGRPIPEVLDFVASLSGGAHRA